MFINIKLILTNFKEKYSNGELDSENLLKFKEENLAKENRIHDLNANLESVNKQLVQAKEEVLFVFNF